MKPEIITKNQKIKSQSGDEEEERKKITISQLKNEENQSDSLKISFQSISKDIIKLEQDSKNFIIF